MTHPVIARRRKEREVMIGQASDWASAAAGRLELRAAVVVGSVARGDFNKWSDLDVLVVADGLPEDWRSRLDLLMADSPPGLHPVGWSPADLASRRQRHDPMASEAYEAGIVVWGTLPPP